MCPFILKTLVIVPPKRALQQNGAPPKRPRTLEQFFPHQVPIQSDDSVTTSHVALNREQTHVLELCMRGQSVFFTGAAGAIPY